MPIQEYTQQSVDLIDINQEINSFFIDNIKKANQINKHYGALWQELHNLINSGGKRIRPLMTIISYEIFGGTNTKGIIPIAAAQELLHLSMLIHDDIIDRDFIRYGVSNIAGRYQQLYEPLVKNEGDRLHYAQSSALLAGDLLISGAYQMIMGAPIVAKKIIAIQQLLGKTIFEVIGGELLDTESAFRSPAEIDTETVAYYKTASYTFIAPLMAGALMANASTKDKLYLRLFAKNLGIAYQLTDDLIGVFGDESKSGKSSSSDLREGKRTYLVEQFYKVATPAEQLLFATYFSKQTISDDDVNILKNLLISTQAKKMTETAILQFIVNARSAVDNLSLDEAHKQKLGDLITTATKRDR